MCPPGESSYTLPVHRSEVRRSSGQHQRAGLLLYLSTACKLQLVSLTAEQMWWGWAGRAWDCRLPGAGEVIVVINFRSLLFRNNFEWLSCRMLDAGPSTSQSHVTQAGDQAIVTWLQLTLATVIIIFWWGRKVLPLLTASAGRPGCEGWETFKHLGVVKENCSSV